MRTNIAVGSLERFTTFGDLLRFLRRRAGLTQLELALEVGYSDAQISRLEQNLRLPDFLTIEARFVPALGLESEPETAARLLELATTVRREDGPAPGLCPYKGLNFFDEADAELFVGREALTAQLTRQVMTLAASGNAAPERFLAVVGASGSGKSSLVRAGLIPALRWNETSAAWHICVFTPTVHPLETLAYALTHEDGSVTAVTTLMDDLAKEVRTLAIFARRKLLATAQRTRLLLVIDQFEELFTLCRSQEERTAFVDNLLSAASEPEGPVILVIALRADFYAHCASYDQLRDGLARQQLYIGAMSPEELRRAIEESAHRGRWEFEAGLIDQLLRDVGQEPGVLPLLSHALLETWQRRRGRKMTLGGYASSGGVQGAIAETAETVFSDLFTPQQQVIARRIFLRLTELGDETSSVDTRRRATFSELTLRPEEAALTHTVLKALADARLIVTSEDSAEVAHEALIREWPTLRGWLEDNREGLRLHRQLTESAQEWLVMGRPPELLFRGIRLAKAAEWAAVHAAELNALEREFLAASTELSTREAAEREAQRQRELDTLRQLAEAEKGRADEQLRNARQLRRRAYYLASLVIVAAIAALAAASFAYQANANYIRSESQRLAGAANNLLLNNGDQNLIGLLAIRSLAMLYTPNGDSVLTTLTTLEAPPREFRDHEADVWGVAFSPDGRFLATGSSDKTARIWDLTTGQTIRILSEHSDEVGEVAFSPDGNQLLTVALDHTARLWDVASGHEVQSLVGHAGGLDAAAFSPNGEYVVTGGFPDTEARIWEVATGRTEHILTGHLFPVIRVAFAPDGRSVLTGSVDGTARIWDAATGSEVRVFRVGAVVGSVAFSADGQYVATGSEDNVARIWDAATGKVLHEFSSHQGFIQGVRFSPDGQFLLTGSADRTARLWNIATGRTVRVFRSHADDVQGVAFSPDGRMVATASNDGIARVWNLDNFPGSRQFEGQGGTVWQASFSPDGKQVLTTNLLNATVWDVARGEAIANLRGHTGDVRGAEFSPDGRLVLTASMDDTARLWDAANGAEMRRFVGHDGPVNRAVFSPDGMFVATASFDGTARLWDAQTGQTIYNFRSHSPGRVNRVEFSPDGKMLATSGDDGTARLWDAVSGTELMVLAGHTDSVAGIAYSPDAKYLATASHDGTVRLWEVSSGAEVRRFNGHSDGAFGVAFSPDGNVLATSGTDGTARLWIVATGQEVRRFAGHTHYVRNVTFSPDGTAILTAASDNMARLWLVDHEEAIEAICALLTRDLTQAERDQYGIRDDEPTCAHS